MTKSKKRFRGCISKKKVALRSRDKVEVKEGLKLYYLNGFSEVLEFKVGGWNDGKTAWSYGTCYYDLRGHGGAGVYPEEEDNPYSFIPIRTCWHDLDKLLAYRKKQLNAMAQKKPKVIKTKTRYPRD